MIVLLKGIEFRMGCEQKKIIVMRVRKVIVSVVFIIT